MVDRTTGCQSEHIDVMQCLLPDMEVLEWHMEPVSCGAVGEYLGVVLELEWDSLQDKAFAIPILNFNNLDSQTIISTSLTYSDVDLVPVPINIIPELAEPNV
ncbi:hypothetical protein V6N12_046009 [Hibiscus sabdariffa]|uniref:Uncharacterized protein n=1 Tax=Hibiscus sabdariffa TaxID=183260 RepID=A0ABR2G4I2_9ROSI